MLGRIVPFPTKSPRLGRRPRRNRLRLRCAALARRQLPNRSASPRFGITTVSCGPQFRPLENYTRGLRPGVMVRCPPAYTAPARLRRLVEAPAIPATPIPPLPSAARRRWESSTDRPIAAEPKAWTTRPKPAEISNVHPTPRRRTNSRTAASADSRIAARSGRTDVRQGRSRRPDHHLMQPPRTARGPRTRWSGSGSPPDHRRGDRRQRSGEPGVARSRSI